MKKKLSIITVNLNNAEGLETTIKSVTGQKNRDFEFIIIDGASTDNSLKVLADYDKQIDLWISEKDKGIYEAMNKGISKSNGAYLLFLNSGDYLYSEDTIGHVMEYLTGEADIVYGN